MALSSPTDKFEFGTRLGIFVSVEAALLSAISASVVLCYTGSKLMKKFRARQAIKKLHTNINLPLIDATDSLGFVGLMFVELIQALGGILSTRWLADGFITEDSLCTTQGHLKQIGDVGVALFSLFIAFDTFFVLVFGWRASRATSSCALVGICLFIILITAIGSGMHHGKGHPFYGDTGYWCWIGPEFGTERIVLEYLWMWLAAFLMLILYGIIALVMHGFIVVEGKKIRLRNKGDALGTKELATSSDIDNEEERANKQIANMMLFYPAIYIFCVLPISIVRWLDFTGHTVPPNAFIAAIVIFSLTGFFDVLLFKFTRPSLISCHNLDPPSNLDLPSTAINHNLPSGTTVAMRRAVGMGALPEDVEVQSPVILSPASETSAARYARTVGGTTTTAGPHTTSTSGTRPRTQDSLRPDSRDSALSSRPAWNEGGPGRVTGLGRLPE